MKMGLVIRPNGKPPYSAYILAAFREGDGRILHPETPSFIPPTTRAMELVAVTQRGGFVDVTDPRMRWMRKRLTQAAWHLWKRTGAVPTPALVAWMWPAVLKRWPRQWPPPKIECGAGKLVDKARVEVLHAEK